MHTSVAGLANDASTSPTTTSLASGQFDATRGASGATDTLPTIPVDLSAPAYDHPTSLTVRTYFYTPTISQNIDLDNLTFNGSVVAVTAPEPVTFRQPRPALSRCFDVVVADRPLHRSLNASHCNLGGDS